MNRTPDVAKLKVSLTLAADLVALVDRDARRRRSTRSGVVEQWLRRAASASVEGELAEATATYYRSLRATDIEEDERLSRALSNASRRVAYDDQTPPHRRRGRR